LNSLAIAQKIARKFARDRLSAYVPYEQDELVNHVYVKIQEYVSQVPLASVNAITEMGLKECRKFIKKEKQVTAKLRQQPDYVIRNLVYKEKEVASSLTKEYLLHVWCESRYMRVYKHLKTRIIGYLYYVEQLPYEEIAEIFGITIQACYGFVTSNLREYRLMPLKPDDAVMLVMDNPFFHGMLGWVKETTDYGAVVEVEMHSPNPPERHKWEVKAVHEEMVYIGTLARKDRVNTVIKTETIGDKKPSNNMVKHKYQVTTTIDGNPCPQCGVMALIRTGNCITCQMCAFNTGCG